MSVDKDSTVIVEGAGNPEAIANRVAVIKSQIETTTSEFDREKLQERLAKLSGGVAVIKVGAATETELKENENSASKMLLTLLVQQLKKVLLQVVVLP